MRIYIGRVKSKNISLTTYKSQLGPDEGLLNTHQTMISTVTETIIEKNMKRNCQLDWETNTIKTSATKGKS